MKIALYRSVGTSYETVCVHSEFLEESGDYVRVSEVVEVDFPERSREEVVKEEVEGIDEQISKQYAKAEDIINALKRRKAELLALPELTEEKDHV